MANASGVKRYNLETPNCRCISKAAARGHKKAVVSSVWHNVIKPLE